MILSVDTKPYNAGQPFPKSSGEPVPQYALSALQSQEGSRLNCAGRRAKLLFEGTLGTHCLGTPRDRVVAGRSMDEIPIAAAAGVTMSIRPRALLRHGAVDALAVEALLPVAEAIPTSLGLSRLARNLGTCLQ